MENSKKNTSRAEQMEPKSALIGASHSLSQMGRSSSLIKLPGEDFLRSGGAGGFKSSTKQILEKAKSQICKQLESKMME